MAARAGVPPEEYAKFMPGTRFLTPEEALDALRAEGRRSSRSTAAARSPTTFNVANKVYAQPQPVDDVHRRLAVEGGAREVASAKRAAQRSREEADHARSLVAAARGAAAARQRRAVGGVVRRAARCSGARSATCRSSGTRWCGSPIRATSTWMTHGHAGRARRVRGRERRGGGAARRGRPSGARANPVFLPAPHEVVRALVTGFTTPPARPDEPWLHQSLWHSIQVIFWGFLLSSIIGVPLGHPVRRAPGDRAADRAVHRVLPLPAGAGVRRAGGRGAGHRRRAQGRDHLHRHVLPAGAGHRQHHAPHRSRAARGGADAGRVAARS